MRFADKLKALRGVKGLTQSGLADASGVSLGTIRDYEQGKIEPAVASLSRLAAALGVDMNAITEDVEWTDRSRRATT